MRTFVCRSALLLAAAALTNATAVAEEVPVSSLPNYDTFRLDMLAAGWIPDFNHGPKRNDGTPMYRHPEVLCGNRICSAQWIAKSDRERIQIILWPDAEVGYRVALQFGEAD